MLERLLIACLLIVVGLVSYRGLKWWCLHRACRLGAQDPLLSTFVPGRPGILYFTSEACSACRTQQQPALARLQAGFGQEQVQIIRVDADHHLPDAERWGVMSLPTTFVLDRQGLPKAVNYGVASAEKLGRQLQEIAGLSAKG